jgi:LysM repeat protein
MKRRTSATARIFAAIALVVAVVAVIAIVSGSDVGSSSSDHKSHHAKKEATHPRTTAKVYVIKTGDTLTAIAHETGVSVSELRALNPEVDPQILVAGEKLKLR